MSKAAPKYLLLSLPTSVVPSHHADDALEAISTTVSAENGSAARFSIPEFKIGTLDALVQQADELAKLESQCQGVVAKVADALRNILDGDEAQIERMMVVNDSGLIPFLSPPGVQLAACGLPERSGAEQNRWPVQANHVIVILI
jgi:V-type H+-transporting ATPase subunit C